MIMSNTIIQRRRHVMMLSHQIDFPEGKTETKLLVTTSSNASFFYSVLQPNQSVNGNNTSIKLQIEQETHASCLAGPFHSYVICCNSQSLSKVLSFFIYKVGITVNALTQGIVDRLKRDDTCENIWQSEKKGT